MVDRRAYFAWTSSLNCDVPASVLTVTGIEPGRRSGTVASSVVWLTYVSSFVLLEPNDTLWKHFLVPKFLPLMVIFWPRFGTIRRHRGDCWVGVIVASLRFSDRAGRSSSRTILSIGLWHPDQDPDQTSDDPKICHGPLGAHRFCRLLLPFSLLRVGRSTGKLPSHCA